MEIFLIKDYTKRMLLKEIIGGRVGMRIWENVDVN